MAASLPRALLVEDRLEPRVRLPADLLRCVIACAELALLAGLGMLARATASGAEIDIVGVSKRLPPPLLTTVGFVAHFVLLILPVVLVARALFRRQFRRLAEGVAAAAITVALVLTANLLLRHPDVKGLYESLTLSQSAGRTVAPLDGYLAGLAAYVTVMGLSGRPRWRAAFWLTIGFYAVASLADAETTVLALLIALLLGVAVGSGLRYVVGAASERPSAEQIAAALSAVGPAISAMRRIWDSSSETRRYAATLRSGGRLDVTVFDRDQQAADALYRLYRRLRLKTHVSRSAPLTLERAVERRALLTYAAEDAGVPTPRLRALIRVGPEAAVLANESRGGTTLADLATEPTDEQLARIWDTVLRLHRRRVTHRALTVDRILLAGDGDGGPGTGGEVVLLDPGNGDVAASDLQLRLDLSQLLAELALLVGPERAAASARAKIGDADLAAMVPLLQPIALHRSTRARLRRRKEVLPTLRKLLLAAAPDGEVAPARLERIRPRTVVTLVASVFAAFLLAGQLAKVSLGTVLRHADWRWSLAALVLSALTYICAAWSLSGFVLERLSLARTSLVALASSFVTLVTPAAVGGVALNLRYLRRSEVEPADAAASVGVAQLVAFVLHALLLLIFAALSSTSQGHSLRPPGWTYIALAVLAAVALAALAVPRGRRLLRSRLAPALGQVIPRLLDISQRPAKLAAGVGGSLLLTASYILCLAASVRALGGSVALVSVAVVYLSGSALGAAVPTPGGLGAVEAALVAGLTAAGLPGATAISSVLLYRIMTFWLPVPLGWAAMHYLQHRDVL